MGVTPNLGIEYPDPSGVPSRKTWVEDPIKSVDTQVQALLTAMGLAGKRIEYGSVTVPVSGSPTTGKTDVTFSQPFPSLPVVLVSTGQWRFTAAWFARTTSGFRVEVRRSDESTSGLTDIGVSWLAIGDA